MKKIDINKHTKYSLELIFSEADKMANQLLKSLSENVNKSFIMFTLFSSLFSYSFIKVIQLEYPYLILLLGSILSSVVIHKNLFPSTVNFRGALPENIIVPYFENFEGDVLDKEILATQIQNYNMAMNLNIKTINSMVNRFNSSIKIILSSFILFGVVFLFMLIKGL